MDEDRLRTFELQIQWRRLEAKKYKPTIKTINRNQLIELQQRDSNLKPLFALVDKPKHDYLIHSGVLLRKWRDNVFPPSAAIHHIVVPSQLRP